MIMNMSEVTGTAHARLAVEHGWGAVVVGTVL